MPALAGLIVGGFWQVIVIFGVHWGVTPMVMANFENYGFDTFQAFQTCAVIAQAAACFGVFLKSRSKDTKNVALSAGLTGIFGITEPAIYGVTLRLKKPFVAGCIGGAAGALVVALTGANYYIYAGLPGLLGGAACYPLEKLAPCPHYPPHLRHLDSVMAVSRALRAYAAAVSSADKGAVRIIG